MITRYLLGFCNENLDYLDLAEPHKHRMDAKARRLDVGLHLFDLIDLDPSSVSGYGRKMVS